MRGDAGRELRVGVGEGRFDRIEGCLVCQLACHPARFLVPSFVPVVVMVRGVGSLG